VKVKVQAWAEYEGTLPDDALQEVTAAVLDVLEYGLGVRVQDSFCSVTEE
jgi:hypothetical protein